MTLKVLVEAASPGGDTDTPVYPAATKRVTALDLIRARASLSPSRLPRRGGRDATLRLGFRSSQAESASIPSLQAIDFEISPHVRLNTGGLPSCDPDKLYANYANGCGKSLVGHGEVSAEVTVRGKQPTIVRGPMKVYYSSYDGASELLALVHGTGSLPVEYVIPFAIRQGESGLGTGLVARQMPLIHGICRGSCGSSYRFTGVYTHISVFRLELHRRFKSHGKPTSVVSADCPARKGRGSLRYPLVRTQLKYSQGTVKGGVARAVCRASRT
jgi:hypothetical protein